MSLISLPRRMLSSALILLIPVFLITAMLVMVLTSHSAYAQAVVAPSCPQGYILSGNNCVKGAPTPSCPAGYTYSGGSCVAGSPAPTTGPWVLIVQKALGVRSARELDGATVCMVSGTPSVAAVTAYFKTNRISFTPVAAGTGSAARDTYLKKACDVLIADDRTSAPALRSLTPAGAHLILPERLVAIAAAPPVRRAAPAPRRPANLALPLQQELKRLGCLTGRVDGVWGGGSRAALNRFNNQIGTSYGSEPSQYVLDEARKRKNGFCAPVRVAPKRKKPVASTSDWDDLDCNDLWYERNGLFAHYGHCFKSARGKAAFHNQPDYPNVCKPPHGKLPADAAADVAAIKQVEGRKNCR